MAIGSTNIHFIIESISKLKGTKNWLILENFHLQATKDTSLIIK